MANTKKEAAAAQQGTEAVDKITAQQTDVTQEQGTENRPEREDIFIPRGATNDEPNLLVSVNGKNYLLPKGKTSNVPWFVADEIRRSQRAQVRFEERQTQLLEKAEKK